MSLTKSEKARRRVEFYKKKVNYFETRLNSWEDELEYLLIKEKTMRVGKMEGQKEV